MKKIVWINLLLILALAILLLFSIKAEGSDQVEVETPVDYSVKAMIERLAPRYGQDPELIYKITYCESQHKIKSHDGGRGKNITGIHDTTFNLWLPLYEKAENETLDIHSSYDQLKMMSWAFSQGESYRRQWTTYRAYINGGTYTFYYKLLKGTYTARCK